MLIGVVDRVRPTVAGADLRPVVLITADPGAVTQPDPADEEVRRALPGILASLAERRIVLEAARIEDLPQARHVIAGRTRTGRIFSVVGARREIVLPSFRDFRKRRLDRAERRALAAHRRLQRRQLLRQIAETRRLRTE